MVAGEDIVQYKVGDGEAWITLNRPDKRNALNKRMWGALKGCLHRAAEDGSVKVVVLTGAGGSFTTGQDIEELASLRSIEEARNFFHEVMKPCYVGLFEISKPTLTVVDGYAYGAGFDLILLCDMVYASRESTFASPGGKLGMYSSMGSLMGPIVIGRRRAAELAFTARRLDADEAEKLGLITRAVGKKELGEEVRKALNQVKENSLPTLQATKRALNRQLNRSDFDPIFDELAELTQTPAFSERIKTWRSR